MYEHDLALNNVQGLMCHKPNQPTDNEFCCPGWPLKENDRKRKDGSFYFGKEPKKKTV